MKKKLIAFAFVVSASGFYFSCCASKDDLMSTTENDRLNDMRPLISTFYMAAQQDIPLIEEELDKLKTQSEKNKDDIAYIKDTLNLYQLVSAIANRDIVAIEAMSSEQLACTGLLTIGDERLTPDVTSKFTDSDGKECLFTGAMLESENALGFVLLNALRDKTDQDKQKTLKMLKILLDKKLDPNATVSIIFWIKHDPESSMSFDYPAEYTFYEVASNWSHPESVILLKEYGMQELKLMSDED